MLEALRQAQVAAKLESDSSRQEGGRFKSQHNYCLSYVTVVAKNEICCMNHVNSSKPTPLPSIARVGHLQLSASSPASVTGVSHRLSTCSIVRCSDRSRSPASPNCGGKQSCLHKSARTALCKQRTFRTGLAGCK